jgi:hypothetical protein
MDMKHRKLRIAWSVVWGVLAVLLVALWVRSYWWFDAWQGGNVHIQAVRGEVAIFNLLHPQTYSKSNFPAKSMHSENFGYIVTGSYETVGPGNISVNLRVSNQGKRLMTVPYWLVASPAIIVAILALSPWLYIRSRFGLRTLLIAMTLVAVVLGAVVWLTR